MLLRLVGSVGLAVAILAGVPRIAAAQAIVGETYPCRWDAAGFPISATGRSTGQLTVHRVDVDGALRMKPVIVLDVVGLTPRQPLTRGAFERAARRLDDIPAASRTQLGCRPFENGAVIVTAMVVERSLFPKGWASWATIGGRAVIVGDLKFDISGWRGAGEVLSSSWRWSKGRPRVAFEYAIPEFGPFPGITTFDLMWDRQTYAVFGTLDGPQTRETRQRFGVGFNDWLADWFVWRAGTALDRFNGRNFMAIEGGVDTRFLDDHLSLDLGVGTWAAMNGGDPFSRGDVSAWWRSTKDVVPPWTAVLGATVTSDTAPLAIWPGATSGKGRGVLLRAHPISQDGTIDSAVFGRSLVYTSFEHQRHVMDTKHGTLYLAGFVDAAKAYRRISDLGASPLHVDVGTGVRINTPRMSGLIRLDVAYGLRDGEFKISAGFMNKWPRRDTKY